MPPFLVDSHIAGVAINLQICVSVLCYFPFRSITVVDTPSPLTSVTMLKDGLTLIGGGADGMFHMCTNCVHAWCVYVHWLVFAYNHTSGFAPFTLCAIQCTRLKYSVYLKERLSDVETQDTYGCQRSMCASFVFA